MEKLDYNQYCHIIETWPKNSKRALLIFGSIFHRTQYPWWNIPSLTWKLYNSRFTTFDWPKQEFDKEKVRQQAIEYIENCWAEEIITVWLSFGHMVATDLISSLPDNLKNKIKWHISVCWVNSYENLNLWNKLSVTVLSKISKNLAWVLWSIDRNWFKIPLILSKRGFSTRLKNMFSKNMVLKSNLSTLLDWNTPTDKKDFLLRRHMKAASLGLTPGVVDRFKAMKENYWNDWTEYDFPIVSLYSTDDGMFSDPKDNAESIINKTVGDWQLIEVKDGWHASIVEKPDHWINPFFSALNKLWWNVVSK